LISKLFFKNKLAYISDCLIQSNLAYLILNLIHIPHERLEIIKMGKTKHAFINENIPLMYLYSEWPEETVYSSPLLLEDTKTPEWMKKCIIF
jgi:hypothetical protein